MSVSLTLEELLKLIRKSGVVEEQKLDEFLRGKSLDGSTDVRPLTESMVRQGLLTNFQAEQLLLGRWRGFTIGRYRYLERIGVGGMGQVFLCEHAQTRRRVAIKVLPPAKAEQPAALGRFYREARAAAALAHPNIVRTHDIGQDGDLHYIVMDYVAGPNLLDLVKQFGPMDIARATSYIHQIALALDFAFRNKIIHRDVKPGNVMIDRRGVARLLDLGLARFLNDHGDQLTLKYDDKIVLGTADYVAPEQIENSHAVDTRADLYALGSTLYFLLAGHPPFPKGTVSQKLLWHRTKEATPIREIRPAVPDGLAAILAQLMAKDPKERYQTPAQVISDLERWLPASVPLPRSEELPQLSPAAMAREGADGADDEAVGLEESSSETMRATASATPTGSLTQARPAPASHGKPQRSNLPADAPVARPRSISTCDTESTAALEVTPPPLRQPRKAKPPRTPSPPRKSARSFPWGLLGAIVVVALVLIVLLVRS